MLGIIFFSSIFMMTLYHKKYYGLLETDSKIAPSDEIEMDGKNLSRFNLEI